MAERFRTDPEHAAWHMIPLTVFDTAREVGAITQILTRIRIPVQWRRNDTTGLTNWGNRYSLSEFPRVHFFRLDFM
jgi:hypothetical protein